MNGRNLNRGLDSTFRAKAAVVDRWHVAYNRRDLDALLALAVPDIEIAPRQPLGRELMGTTFVGHTGLKTLMRWTFESYPDVVAEWENPREIPGWVMSPAIYRFAAGGAGTRAFALFDVVGQQVRRIGAFPDEAAALAAARPLPVLTAREREMFEMLSRGLTAQQIADELYLSVHTVRTHVQNAIGRLGAKTRMHALSLALERGEIGPGGEHRVNGGGPH